MPGAYESNKRLFATIFQAPRLANKGFHVVSGMEVRAQSPTTMDVDIDSGTYARNDFKRAFAGVTVTIGAASADDRFDLIYVDADGVAQVAAGTPAATNAFPPAVPEDAIPLAYVFVDSAALSIANEDIFDVRQVKYLDPEPSADGVYFTPSLPDRSKVSAQAVPNLTVRVAEGIYYSQGKRIRHGAVPTITLTPHASLAKYATIVASSDENVAQVRNTTARNVFGANWAAQSFTTSSVTDGIAGLELILQKVGSPSGNLVVSIQANSSGAPSGTDLASFTVSASTVSTSKEWFFIGLNSVQLSPSTLYWIVARVPSGDGSNYIAWFYQNTDVYAGGNASTSGNSGGTWSGASTQDQTFILYLGRIYAIEGEPSERPSVPKAPANAIRLAVVYERPAAATITNADIQDARVRIGSDWDFSLDTSGMSLTLSSSSSITSAKRTILSSAFAVSRFRNYAPSGGSSFASATVNVIADGITYTFSHSDSDSGTSSLVGADQVSVAMVSFGGPILARFRMEITTSIGGGGNASSGSNLGTAYYA